MDVAALKNIELPLLLSPSTVEMFLDFLFFADDPFSESDRACDLRLEPELLQAVGEVLLHKHVNVLIATQKQEEAE